MEYIIWGLTADQSDKMHEQPLYTHAKSMEETRKVMEILFNKHGCHKMRVQVIDGSMPDFVAAIKV